MKYTGIRIISPETITLESTVGAITPYTSSTLKANEDYIFQFKIINYSNTTTLDKIQLISEDGTETNLTL